MTEIEKNRVQNEEELSSFIATGKKDFLWRLVLHLEATILLLLCSPVVHQGGVHVMGWVVHDAEKLWYVKL